jgi:hypothetical protein
MEKSTISNNSVVGSNPVHGFGVRDFWRFRWVRSSILVDEPGFGMVRSSVFPDLGLGSKFRLFGGVREGSKFGFGG